MRKPTSDSRHWFVENDDAAGDSINISCMGNMIHVEIDEPWAGDTETGFGRTSSIKLDRERVADLVRWLTEHFLEVP